MICCCTPIKYHDTKHHKPVQKLSIAHEFKDRKVACRRLGVALPGNGAEARVGQETRRSHDRGHATPQSLYGHSGVCDRNFIPCTEQICVCMLLILSSAFKRHMDPQVTHKIKYIIFNSTIWSPHSTSYTMKAWATASARL
jgi:hypothetical protein